MYQQLVDLKGWSEEEERANWEEGFIRSKRTFVESQLPALRRMGFRKSKSFYFEKDGDRIS